MIIEDIKKMLNASKSQLFDVLYFVIIYLQNKLIFWAILTHKNEEG